MMHYRQTEDKKARHQKSWLKDKRLPPNILYTAEQVNCRKNTTVNEK